MDCYQRSSCGSGHLPEVIRYLRKRAGNRPLFYCINYFIVI
nr:MAG TPA: hypothetical protein [Caudoviricetes sp.]